MGIFLFIASKGIVVSETAHVPSLRDMARCLGLSCASPMHAIHAKPFFQCLLLIIPIVHIFGSMVPFACTSKPIVTDMDFAGSLVRRVLRNMKSHQIRDGCGTAFAAS